MYNNAFNNERFHLSHITTRDEVRLFADYLVNGLDINFHPDDPFEGYVNCQTGERTFSDMDAAVGNRLMDECFNVCDASEDEIYDIMGAFLFERLGLNS